MTLGMDALRGYIAEVAVVGTRSSEGRTRLNSSGVACAVALPGVSSL